MVQVKCLVAACRFLPLHRAGFESGVIHHHRAGFESGSGLRAQGSGLRAQGSELRAQGSGLRAQGQGQGQDQVKIKSGATSCLGICFGLLDQMYPYQPGCHLGTRAAYQAGTPIVVLLTAATNPWLALEPHPLDLSQLWSHAPLI